MKLGRRILGERLFIALMKPTFFGQFVASENEKDVKVTVDHLNKYGVKSILDYSAEEDISSKQAGKLEMKYAIRSLFVICCFDDLEFLFLLCLTIMFMKIRCSRLD